MVQKRYLTALMVKVSPEMCQLAKILSKLLPLLMMTLEITFMSLQLGLMSFMALDVLLGLCN